jgi:hypothetical protein
MNEWLPAALKGEIPEFEDHYDYILDNLTAKNTKATAEYRAIVRQKVSDHLMANAGKGKGGKGLKPHQRASRRRNPRARGGLDRAVRGLFDEDQYAEKAPPLPPEPEI